MYVYLTSHINYSMCASKGNGALSIQVFASKVQVLKDFNEYQCKESVKAKIVKCITLMINTFNTLYN